MQLAKPAVYVLVRVPKAGSTSLLTMIRDGLPNAHQFGLPYLPGPADPLPLGERLRAARSRVRTLLRRYSALSMSQAWRYIDGHARDGDLVSGHIHYGDPVLPSLRLNYITLLREPLARALSEYNYIRSGYLKRNRLQRAYMHGRIRAAGTYSFPGYLAYLDEHTAGNANTMSAFALGPQPVSDPLAFLQTNYFHFGVLEHFDMFAAELSRKLGAAMQPRQANVTARREAHALSSADRPVFERIYGRDIALYDAVLAHLRVSAGR
jgi:hypothetical protein